MDFCERYTIEANLSVWLNAFKGVFPPLFLKLLLCLHHARTNGDDKFLKELPSRLDHLYLISRQHPFQRADRLRLQWPKEKVDLYHKQCFSGMADAHACESIAYAWAMRGPYGPMLQKALDYDKWDDVLRVVGQQEMKTGMRIPKIDGILYPFNVGRPPSTWTKTELYRYFASRLWIMIFCCNKFWITKTNVSTEFKLPGHISSFADSNCHEGQRLDHNLLYSVSRSSFRQ